jgi:septal ring factor EnvC (AmiA/AmiB activator)
MTHIVEVPTVAEIPLPHKVEPLSDEHEVIARAHLVVDKAHKERHQLQVMLTEATLAIEARNRTIKSLELELAEARNNLAAMADNVERNRQEVSGIKAFHAEQLASLKHMVARHDHFEIPLPIRRKVNNGKQISP